MRVTAAMLDEVKDSAVRGRSVAPGVHPPVGRDVGMTEIEQQGAPGSLAGQASHRDQG